MWLFGRNKSSSYKPVQRQVLITTTVEGPSDRYTALLKSPISFPSSSAVPDDQISGIISDRFNNSSCSGSREALDACTWSNVTSPGFPTRIVHQASGTSPLKEFNIGSNSPLNRSVFSGSPNRHLKLGQLPYSSWRQKQNKSSPLQLPSNSLSRRSRGRYNDNGTVFVRIAPVDPEKGLLSPLQPGGSAASNLPNLSGDNFSRSPPNGGLGGIPQSALSARFQRLWPSTNPIDRSLRMAPSANPGSSGILEALANRKRSRANDAFVDKTTTPMRSSVMNDDTPNKSSKRVKFLHEERNNRSLSLVPLHNLHGPEDESMTSESILEQMNQTEKRFLPDDDSPTTIRMLQKKKSSAARGVSMQTSPFKKKKFPNTISVVEKEDPKEKNGRLCTCTECYEEAAGVSCFVQNNVLPNRNNSISQPGSSKKSVTFDMSTSELSPPTKLVVSRSTETDIIAKEIVITKSAVLSGGIIDMEMYTTDKKRREERLRRILRLDDPALQEPIAVPEVLRESSFGFGTDAKSLASKTSESVSFGLPSISSDDVDGRSKDATQSVPITSFSSTVTPSTDQEVNIPKAGGFTFGSTLASSPLTSVSNSNEGENVDVGAKAVDRSEDAAKSVPVTSLSSTILSFAAKDSEINISKAGGFTFGSTLASSPLTNVSKEGENINVGAKAFDRSEDTAISVPNALFPSTVASSTDSEVNIPKAGGFTFGSTLSVSKEGENVNVGAKAFDRSENTAKSVPITLFPSTIAASTDTEVNIPKADGFIFGSTLASSPLTSVSKEGENVNVSAKAFDGSEDTAKPVPVTPFVSFGAESKSKPFTFGQQTVTATSTGVNFNAGSSFNFGSTSTNSAVAESPPFGGATAETSSSVFGSASGTSAPAFRSTSGTNQLPFGSTNATNPPTFGSTLSTNTLTFGSGTTSTPSAFGGSSGTNSNLPSFGGTSEGTVQSGFDAPSAAFNFQGQPQTAQTPFVTFGTESKSKPFTFGQPAATSTGVNFSAGSSSFNFGSNSTNSAVAESTPFGGATSGANSPAFGLASGTSTPTFRSTPATNPPPFGSTNATNPQSFGSTNVTSPQSFGSNNVTNPQPFGSTNAINPPAFGSTPSTNTLTFGSGSTSNSSAFGGSTGTNPASFGGTTGGTAQPGFDAPSAAFNFQTQPQTVQTPFVTFGTDSKSKPFTFGQQAAAATPSGVNFNAGSSSFNFGSNSKSSSGAEILPGGATSGTNSSAFGSASGTGAQTFRSTPGTNPPPFGATNATNPPAFGSTPSTNTITFGSGSTSNSSAFGGSSGTNPPSFGGTSGGAVQQGFNAPAAPFNFQAQAQTVQTGGFSFGQNNNTNASTANSQGLFQFGQPQPQQPPPQGGFNFTAPPAAGAPMFSLGSTNATPTTRRRDRPNRRYR